MKTELDLRGVPVSRSPGGAISAGPVFCPIYFVENTLDKVFVDDPAFVSSKDDMEAAKIAIMRRVDTALAGLVWAKRVGVVQLSGVRCRPGRVGAFDVLFFSGPTFDNGRREDDRVILARRAAGLPTGEPGDRKIRVAHKSEL